jgi:hypothetical protein
VRAGLQVLVGGAMTKVIGSYFPRIGRDGGIARAQLIVIILLDEVYVKSLVWVRNINHSSWAWNVDFGVARDN